LINLPKDDEIRSVLVHALKHYRQRLKNLANNDETVQLGNDILQKDLEDNVEEADDAAEHLVGVNTLVPTSFGNKKGIVEPALTCYIADLTKSKEALREKLGIAIPNLESVDREIQVAEFCKQTLL
jgi:hypothetical protein